MLNLINKETRQIPGWPVVQGRGVDRVRSTQPPPRGWEILLVISRCLASLSHPLWHSPSQPSPSKAARYVRHIRTRQSHIMIGVHRINRIRANYRDALLECCGSFLKTHFRCVKLYEIDMEDENVYANKIIEIYFLAEICFTHYIFLHIIYVLFMWTFEP